MPHLPILDADWLKARYQGGELAAYGTGRVELGGIRGRGEPGFGESSFAHKLRRIGKNFACIFAGMSAYGHSRRRSGSVVGEDVVRMVMDGCGCSETRARSLLRVHSNPSEAIKFHRDTSSSLSERPPVRRRSRDRRDSYSRRDTSRDYHGAHTEEIQTRGSHRYPPNSMQTGPGRYFSETGCIVPSGPGARSEILGGTTRVPSTERREKGRGGMEVFHAAPGGRDKGYYDEPGFSVARPKAQSTLSQDSGISVGRRASRRDIHVPSATKLETNKPLPNLFQAFRSPVDDPLVPSPHALRAGLASFRPGRNSDDLFESEESTPSSPPRPSLNIKIPGRDREDGYTPQHLRTPTSSTGSDSGFEDLGRTAPESPVIIPLKINKQPIQLSKPPAPKLPSKLPSTSETPAWDFRLPSFSAPVDGLNRPSPSSNATFSLRALIGALQAGTPHAQVGAYLSAFDRTAIQAALSSPLSDFPPVFYAVATNDEQILRLFVEYGADVNATAKEPPVPLLGFSVCFAEGKGVDMTPMVRTLLSLGADALSVPKAFYLNPLADLSEDGPSSVSFSSNQAWCTPLSIRRILARNLNLTMRYFLSKTLTLKRPYIRHHQVATHFQAEALLGIHYFLIGQTHAASALKKKLLAHMLVGRDRPLVLVFAGPSGHGKTELARSLGRVLSLPMNLTDCTTHSKETDLFGPRAPYAGSERGSPLNNFLAEQDGKRSIVFLDEFEKTTRDIWKALLIPFDEGRYQDRRNGKEIDCSKTIWILATNQLDPTIKKFCAENPALLAHDAVEEDEVSSEATQNSLLRKLETQLKDGFKSHFEPPLTGRLSAILPFLPFTPLEAAIVSHKYLLSLSTSIRRPINLTPTPTNPLQLVGNITLRIPRDAEVCRKLAEGYDEDLGARSLIAGVKSVEEGLVEAYLDVEERIREGVGGTELVARVGDGGVEVVPA